MKEVTKMSRLAGQLEKLYNRLNADFFGGAMTAPVITIQSTPRAYGHYTTYDAWNVGGTGKREINIGAGTLDRPIEDILATLLHEMCHQYNDQILGVKDCSGAYHNKKFKATAETYGGLVIKKHSTYGWTITEPGEKLLDWILENNIQDIKLTRQEFNEFTMKTVPTAGASVSVPDTAKETEKKKSNVRRYVCPKCGQIARATKEVHIGCWDCMVQMVEQESKKKKAD